MELYEELGGVNSKDDFLKFLNSLINDNTNNDEEWENRSIAEYLGSIRSWVEDMEGYYKNNNLSVPKINWNFLATIFYVGKIYE